MGVLIPPGFGNLTFVMTHVGDSEPMMTAIGVDPAGTSLDGPGIAQSAYALWAAQWLTQQPGNLVLEEVRYSVGQDGTDPLTYVYQGTDNGNGGSAYLPQNCALLVKKQTALGGRRGRGRMYIPYLLTENYVDPVGNIDPTYVGGLQDIADDFYDGLVSADLQPVLLHDPGGFGVEPPPTPILQLSVDNKIATQRRRLRR